MTKRKYGMFGTISSASFAGGDAGTPGWITATYEGTRANNITYMYANARHNVLNVSYHGAVSHSADSVDYVVTPWGMAGEAMEDWSGAFAFYKAPITGRVTHPGNLRVWILCKTSSESAAAGVRILAAAPYAVSVSTTVHSSTTTWYSLDLTLPATNPPMTYPEPYNTQGGQNLCLYAERAIGTANTLTVYCVCAYQRQQAATPTHLSLNAVGNVIGADDKPMSQAIAKMLQDEVNCQYNQRFPHSNVAAHWFPKYYAVAAAAYPAAANNLGEYKFVKRAGCSAMYVYTCVNNSATVSSEWTLKSTIASTVEVTREIADIRYNACHYWVGSKFTFSTANLALEKELTLQLCHKLTATSAAVACLHGVCITEKPPSASSVAHTIPDISQYYVGGYLLGSQVENERTTLTHLWQRQPAIALSDWRMTVPTYPNMVRCSSTTYTKKDPPLATGGSQSSVIARALVFPSYGCRRLRVTVGFQTYLGVNAREESSDTLKGIMFQLSDSTVNATAVWTGPDSYTDTSGDVQQTYFEGYCDVNSWERDQSRPGHQRSGQRWVDDFMYHVGSPPYPNQMNLRAETSVVSSTRWLSPTSTISAASLQNPLQLWVFGWSAATADYVAPTYVSIEEVPLTEDEFP